MLKIKIPFTYIGKTKLGKIYRPYIKIEFSSSKIDEWIPVEAVLDTGADYTLLPRRYAQLLGIDVMQDCIPETTLGVGGSETIYLLKRDVKLKIGSWEKNIPLGFLERDDIPGLLGRLECLEALEITLKDLQTLLSLA